jgi:type IV pilus assembly protein PilY1
VAWSYTHPEVQQSWSEVKTASIPVAVSAQGERTFKDVAIFTGGYDIEEDFFPEPFTDQDANGTPFAANGSIDNSEWSKNTASQDVYDDDLYNRYNPAMNEYGRGIFVVDLDDPAAVTSVAVASGPAQQVLPFSATYGATAVATGVTQTFPEMQFSFPASPSVATGTDRYLYNSASGPAYQYANNVLLAVYGVDIYANLFKVRYDFQLENTGTTSSPNWQVTSTGWQVNRLFSANPGSDSVSGRLGGGVNTDEYDKGRKAFYPPAISWRGSKGYFEAGNYVFPNVSFDNTDTMASLFFGTGDRENPKYTMIRNRFYAVYDDASVTATQSVPVPDTPVAVSSAPYQEDDLLNLTCDELDKDTVINSCYLGPLDGACSAATASEDMKTCLRSLLKDDAVYGTPVALENGPAHENDAKGWYIVLPDQGQSSACGHVSYPTTIDSLTSTDHDNHIGEHVLSEANLYFGTLYFTTYQPSIDDPCNPQGNGFSYALNYLDASATYNLMPEAPDATKYFDIADRYNKFTGIKGIPSGFTIVLRDGHAAAMASMGGSIIGPNVGGGTEIETPGLGLELYYWRDSSSEQ